MKNENGSAIVLGLIFLVLISLSGSVMLTFTRMDKTNQSSYNRIRTAQQAAFTAFKACEGSFANDPKSAEAILEGYTKDHSKKWLLLTADKADTEHKIALDGEPGSPKYSANIVGFGVGHDIDGKAGVTPFIKIEGIGYGKVGGEKKGIALYNLNGLIYSEPSPPKYAIYIATDGYDFNQPIHLIGDIYFGSGFRFNSNANGSIIDGNIKTANKSTLSEFNGGVTINGKAFFQTPIKIQNYTITIKGNGGFKRNIELSKDIVLGGDSYFNGNLTGSSRADLTNHIANYYSGKDDHFIHYTPSPKGSAIDIATELDMPDGDDPPPVFNLNVLSPYVRDVPHNPPLIFTANEIQKIYDATPSKKKWEGYLVMRIRSCSNVDLNNTSGVFSGKVIWIIEKPLGVNGNWYASDANASTIIYVKDGGNLSQLGWPGHMKGYIYVTGTGSITYAFKSGSSFEGAINHVNGSGFQVNTSNTVTIQYGEALINDLSAKGLITKTMYNLSPTLKLVDAKIRPVLMSMQL